MELFTSLIDFFQIDPLTSSATFVDVINYIISLTLAVYLVCFLIRSLFLMISSPMWEGWR